MTESHQPTTLLVQGQKLDVSEEGDIVTGKGAEILQAIPRAGKAITFGQLRSETNESIVLTNKDDVVELAFEDDLILYTSVQRLQEEIIPAAQRGATEGEVVLPARLSFSNQRTRGEDGLLVKSLKVLDLKGTLIDAAGTKTGQFAARKIAEKIEEETLAGSKILYHLSVDESREKNKTILKPASGKDVDVTQPVLLFIHGTFSCTDGCYSDLWNPPSGVTDTIWQDIQKKYKNNIFALEHRTLTHSPIDNVVDLLDKLPPYCHLHLVSHSRGGLVGELLCRNQFKNSRAPFTNEDIALFNTKKSPGLAGLFAETKEDYQHHQKQLKKLNELLLKKQPIVDRFVRVACPARGTTLASGKLDIYLSGILNVIGYIPALKASSVYSFLKAFTLAAAKERTNPEQLPGLEMQMPGSPFIVMLNSAQESVSADLAVIKGDIEPTGIFKKISLFFLDRFYESDHDLVVNTPSMDGGALRKDRIPVMFDCGNEINHFRYFANSKTRDGLFAGLTETHPPKGYQLEEQKAVEIARSMPMGKQADEVPSVFILPGLLGSQLAIDGKRVWVDIPELVRGRFAELNLSTANVQPQGPMAEPYGDLIDYLGNSHYVIPFGFDWRQSLLDSGQKLGAAIDERLRNSKQPVRIIAHSVGGLVALAMMSECTDIWDQMQNRKGSRILMLATPCRGSYYIPRIFARQERLVKMLALADLHHSQDELLDVLRTFPGLLELLPVDENGKFIITGSLWDAFKQALGGNMERPENIALDLAQKTSEQLSKVELDPALVSYIAGQGPATPASVSVQESKEKTKEIIFTQTSEGDGRVAWKTGIPKGIKPWYVNAMHGDIPEYRPAFKAFLQILETGSTDLLATHPPIVSGMEKGTILLPDTVDIFPNKKQLIAAALGKDPRGRKKPKPRLPPLKVSVVHSNLAFTHFPLAVGHYVGDTIVSAEAALDARLDHRLSKRLQRGVYPGPLMTNEILFNDSPNKFPGAIIVGLGEVGNLTPGTLTATFRDAVIRFALIGLETNQFAEKPISLSTMLIGTGANRLTIKDSITSLIRGVLQANKALAGPTINTDLIITELEFIELYEDLAIEAQYELLNSERNVEFKTITVAQKTIIQGEGGRSRAFFKENDDWWQRLRIETTRDGGLKYTSLTANARAEMRIQGVQRQSVEPFLEELTTQTSTSSNTGRVLFELLIPPELKSHAAENRRLMLVLDKEAASYPWELFEYEGRERNEALAIKAGMIRQLATPDITQTTVCTDLTALVVGDPDSGQDSLFADLPGAELEARKVAEILRDNRIEIKDLLVKETGSNILTRLMTDKYGILHLAGHGVVDFEREGNPNDSCKQKNNLVTGMVIGKNQFLTSTEIRQMPYTPAFVFINCCHLGKISGKQKQHMEKRYHLAANLATQFIEQGVKAVIAAGWAVDDNAALTFAEKFYEMFLGGESFGESVKQARTTTQSNHPNVNTWGAYQCYGDPGYRIANGINNKEARSKNSFVSLAEYVVAIKNISEDAKTASNSKTVELRSRLRNILQDLPEEYAEDAVLLASKGNALGELDQFQDAIHAYTKALQAQKAHAPIHCAEQLANFKVRSAIEKATGKANDPAEELIKEAITILSSLNDRYGESVERFALLGSSYKRRAALHVNNRDKLRNDLQEMRDNYTKAHEKSLELHGEIYAYPLIQALTARWLLHLAGEVDDELEDFDMLLESAKPAKMIPELNRESFWESITVNDCDLLAALKKGQFTKEKADSIAEEYENIRQVASSARQMRSVAEHVEFLCTMATKLEFANFEAKDLQMLAKRLRKMC